MDATPPSDLPDPTSPTPAARQPTTPGATGGKPRIRSVPTPVGRVPRLPGTYAANYSGEDMNWRRAVTILWVLFGLTAAVELLSGVDLLLAGITEWSRTSDLARVGLNAVVFALLWLGWGWVRWVLVVVDFMAGISAVMLSVILASSMRGTFPEGAAAALNSPLITTLPAIALGLLYLSTALYLAISADVVDFVRHRREEGRGWVVGPVVFLGLAYLGALLAVPVVHAAWAEKQPALAKGFGDDLARRMAERWDAKTIEGLGDERFDKLWSADYRQKVFASLAPLGPLEKPPQGNIRLLPTAFVWSRGGFLRQYSYSLPKARFAHGSADIDIFLVKPLFRPWQIDDLQMNEVHYDPKPKPPAPPAPIPVTPTGATAVPPGSL